MVRAALALISAVALVVGFSACASLLGIDELTSSIDAAATSQDDAIGSDAFVAVDATVLADAAVDAGRGADSDAAVASEATSDATPDAEASGDFTVRPDAFACPTAQLVGADTVNAMGTVSASGVDVYTFALTQAASVLVRVRTGAATADVTVGTGCDGTGAVFLPSRVAMNGVYTRGALTPGTYYVTVTWDASMLPGSTYSFDILRYSPTGNATCAQASPLTTTATLTGRTFDANDVTPSCRTASPYGQVFYTVQVPTNESWQITAAAATPVWSPWTVVLQAFSLCTSTTCAVPAALSESAGASASLSLQSSPTAPQTYLVGVSASADDAVTGGGGFTISAKVLAACLGENTPCAGGICCGGHCQPPTTQNGCGHTCMAGCLAGGAVCTSGACACPAATPVLCPTTTSPSCTNPLTDPSNCSPAGACGNVCTNTDPHALPDVSCKGGVCTTTCRAGYTHCNKLCTDFQNDPKHCGKCSGTGAVCPAAEVCQGGQCVCPSSANPDFCGTACTNVASDRNNCGACGNRCPAAETCQSGHCACPTVGKPDFCGAVCTSVQTDKANCGSCGARCGTPQTCQGGVCKCLDVANPNYCAPSCTSTQTDNNNCGSCGRVCTGGQSCVSGTCACPSSAPTFCTGVCTDTQSDGNHCGTCPHVCAVGKTCHGGTCGCFDLANPDYCGVMCTSKLSDNANCGTCGTVCGPLTCQDGGCSCPPANPFQCGASCCAPSTDGGAPGCDSGVCF